MSSAAVRGHSPINVENICGWRALTGLATSIAAVKLKYGVEYQFKVATSPPELKSDLDPASLNRRFYPGLHQEH